MAFKRGPRRAGWGMQYLVRHRTVYHYPDKVAESHHVARLRPMENGGQRCLQHQLAIDPVPAVREERVDAFGNRCVFFAQQAAYGVLTVEAVSVVETSAGVVTDLEASPSWEEVVDLLAEDASAVHLEAQPFRWPTQQTWIAPSRRRDMLSNRGAACRSKSARNGSRNCRRR